MADFNVTRLTRQMLKRHRKEPPSLVLHLYPTHFRFEQQHGNFNYDSPMKCFLEAIRDQKLPTDLLEVLDEAGVRYYEGCLIVEVRDHRSAPQLPAALRPGLALSFQPNHKREGPSVASKAEAYRIVLGPNPATLWTEIGILDKNWMAQKQEREGEVEGETEEPRRGLTEEEAVEIEAMILARTAPPLCLSPSLQTTRLANLMLRATTSRPPKRKRPCGSGDEDEDEEAEGIARRDREERERVMKIGDEGVGRGRGHAFARMALILAFRERRANPNPSPAPSVAPLPVPAAPSAPLPLSGITSLRLGLGSASSSSTPGPSSNVNISGGASPANSGSHKRQKKKSAAAHDSDATPSSSSHYQKKQSKKSQLAHGSATPSLDADDPTLPVDPTEKEQVLADRRKLKKKMENKEKNREKKRLQDAAQDLQVTSGMGTGYAWAQQ